MKNNNFVRGALILIIFNVIGKAIGAIYRIPLANLLGSQGIGMYQLIFPFYSLLLTISTSGIPVAISKLVSEFNSKNQHKNSKKLLGFSVLYLTGLSIVCALIIVLFAKPIAGLQGNKDIYLCYYGIVPAVLLVGVISALRGYFQGYLKMMPTAISSLIEQVFKLLCGLYFVRKLLVFGDVYGVLGALIGISVSEIACLLFLTGYYLVFSRRNQSKQQVETLSYRDISKRMLSIAIPITLGGLSAPITSVIDSLLVVNILMLSGLSSGLATTLLGLQAGIVDPIVSIPIIISVSISASLLPNLSSSITSGDREEVKTLIEKAFQITLSVTVACAVCFVIFGRQIIEFLYGKSLDEFEILTSTKLLFLGGFNLIFLSIVQVTAGVLQGLGKQKIPLYSIAIGSVIKIVLTAGLLFVPGINIFGATIAAGISYFVQCVINYGYIKKYTDARLFKFYGNVVSQEFFVCLFAYFTNSLMVSTFGGNVALVVAGAISVAIFCVTYYLFFMQRFQSKLSTT